MSGLKNSPFGKRLRASHKEPGADEDGSQVNPIFGVGVGGSSSTPGLDSRPTTGGGGSSSLGPDSPTRTTFRSPFAVPRVKDYGDRFVPSKDSGDLRTSYHLMDDGGQSTPHKNRIIPSESDALKGESFFLVFLPIVPLIHMRFRRTSKCSFHLDIAHRSYPSNISNAAHRIGLGPLTIHTHEAATFRLQLSVQPRHPYPASR